MFFVLAVMYGFVGLMLDDQTAPEGMC
jgi:hypothetical protein